MAGHTIHLVARSPTSLNSVRVISKGGTLTDVNQQHSKRTPQQPRVCQALELIQLLDWIIICYQPSWAQALLIALDDQLRKTNTRVHCGCKCVSPTTMYCSPRLHCIHQTGKSYRSNNAGDGPEKTRDRKNWFPRFKSTWLGTYRSKQMFVCCECAVHTATNGRYKASDGKHCACGRDQWHLAKVVEETEYNRRMEICKMYGGMRYDEALLRMNGSAGHSPAETSGVKRTRCESGDSTKSGELFCQSPHSQIIEGKRMKRDRINPSTDIRLEPIHLVSHCWHPDSSSRFSATSDPSSFDEHSAHRANEKALENPRSHGYIGDGAFQNGYTPNTVHHLPDFIGGCDESMVDILSGFLEPDSMSAIISSEPLPAPMTLPPPPTEDIKFDFVSSVDDGAGFDQLKIHCSPVYIDTESTYVDQESRCVNPYDSHVALSVWSQQCRPWNPLKI